MTEPIRNPAAFTYPEPSFISKLFAKVGIQAAEAVYKQLIDESHWQYENGKEVDHAAAREGGFPGTIIRATIGMEVDTAWKAGNWKRALDDGMMVQTYHFHIGNMSGSNQADFHLNATKEFADEVEKYGAIVVSYGDYEADGTTTPVTTRKQNMLAFQTYLHNNNRENGIYSSVKYYLELLGNIAPPPWCWLWGAHWTAGTPVFPSVWNKAKIVAWQYAVWDNFSFAKPVPGNVPDIDVNKWIYALTMKDFLNWGTTSPPPVDCCDKLDAKINDLASSVGNQFAEINRVLSELKSAIGLHVPVTTVNVSKDSVLRWDRTYNGVYKPKYDFYPTGSVDDVGKRIHVIGKLMIFPIPLIGDGGQVCYMVVEPKYYIGIPAGITLFIRKEDIVFPT
jgi:GH25 family lysozyme M1 (1,4-beta-N-acetylmuramidase)